MLISLSTWLQQQKLGLMDLLVLNIFFEHTSRTVREWKSLPSDIVSAKSLDIIKNMLSGYLRGD